MPRIHFFEIEDQTWCPDVVRDCATDYLRFVTTRFDAYASIADRLSEIIARLPDPHIVDLGSGSGGGWPKLIEYLADDCPDVQVTFTDYYPNEVGLRSIVATRPDTFRFYPESIDARDVPETLTGLRTQFLSLHHFRPDDARTILENAVNSDQPIAVFELTERNLRNMISTLLSPILVALVTPFIRPFSLWRLVLTYVIPVVPFVVAFDGFVSTWRTYSEAELRRLIDSIPGNSRFVWSLGTTNALLPVVYLTGVPKTLL